MITSIAAENTPNLVAACQNQAAGSQTSGALADIKPYMEHPEWELGFERADYF